MRAWKKNYISDLKPFLDVVDRFREHIFCHANKLSLREAAKSYFLDSVTKRREGDKGLATKNKKLFLKL